MLTQTKNGQRVLLERFNEIFDRIIEQYNDRDDPIRIALYELKQKCEDPEYLFRDEYVDPLIQRKLIDDQHRPLPDVCKMMDVVISLENEFIVLDIPVEVYLDYH